MHYARSKWWEQQRSSESKAASQIVGQWLGTGVLGCIYGGGGMQKCAYYAMQCSEQQQRLRQEASRATRRQRRARNKSQVWRRTDSGSLMLFGESSPSSVIRSKLFAKSVFTTSMPILWATYYRWSTLLFVGMTTLPEERRSGKKEDRGARQAIIFWVCWLPSTLFEVSWNTNTFILYG